MIKWIVFAIKGAIMEPNYVIRSDEAVLRLVNDNKTFRLMIDVLSIMIGLLLIGSVLFFRFSWIGNVLFILFVISLNLIGNKRRKVPSPFEIRFYDNHLVLYKEKHYYDRKTSNMEFNKIYYSDIKTCQFRTNSQKINIYGIVEKIWYIYNIAGSVSGIPTYHKTVDSICGFYTCASNVDFVSEIEEHSPIKLDLRES